MFPFYGTNIHNMQLAEIVHGIVAMLFIASYAGTHLHRHDRHGRRIRGHGRGDRGPQLGQRTSQLMARTRESAHRFDRAAAGKTWGDTGRIAAPISSVSHAEPTMRPGKSMKYVNYHEQHSQHRQ